MTLNSVPNTLMSYFLVFTIKGLFLFLVTLKNPSPSNITLRDSFRKDVGNFKVLREFNPQIRN